MESISKIAAVALGGSIGAIARYLINISALAGFGGKFPLPTFLINIVGSFLAGILFVLLSERFLTNEGARLFLMVGFLGAFTTFSAFEIELYTMMRDGQSMLAILYLITSALLGLLAVAAGVALARLLFVE